MNKFDIANGERRIICPWCGRLFNVGSYNVNIDHVFPKSYFRHIKWYFPPYTYLSVNDPANLVLTCYSCNRSKSNVILIPTWHVNGKFRNWSVSRLKEYADYFSILVPYQIVWNESIKRCNQDIAWIQEDCNAALDALRKFQKEYSHRKATDDWFFSQP